VTKPEEKRQLWILRRNVAGGSIEQMRCDAANGSIEL
jgi:hypothetical protein